MEYHAYYFILYDIQFHFSQDTSGIPSPFKITIGQNRE